MELPEPGVLFVDDDPDITAHFRELFSNQFRLFTTSNPNYGLRLIEENDIGVVISDHYMPEMTGIEFLSKTLKKHPLVRRILISGRMNVNIAMDSVEISKTHKILVKPFVYEELYEEILSQLKIYKLKVRNKLQIEGLDKVIDTPFDIFEIQVQDLYSISCTMSSIDNFQDYLIKLIEVMKNTIQYTKMLTDMYSSDPSKFSKAMQYCQLNLQDLEIIAIHYKQINLQIFVLILQSYYSLLAEEYIEAKDYYQNYLAFSEMITSPILRKLLKKHEEFLFYTLKTDSMIESIVSKNIANIYSSINILFNFEIASLLKFNERIFQFYSKKTQPKNYNIIILKDDLIVYHKNSLKKTDSSNIYSSIEKLLTLSLELHGKKSISKTIKFDGGAILIQNFKNVKYIAVMSEITIESRYKLRKFAIETLEIIKTIPILSIPDKDDINYITKLANEIF